MAGQLLIEDLLGRLESDSAFATALETDTFAALEGAGYEDLARAVETERDRVSGLVDRIYEDDLFRRSIEEDPATALSEWGLPEDAVEPLLALVGAPGEVLERATADVEAHLGRKPATVAALTAILGALAFSQQASASTHPATKAQVSHPGAKAQVSHVATAAEVARPGAKTLISHAATAAEVSRPALKAQVVRGEWQGVAAKPDAKWQSRILSTLRAQGSLLR
jgi:putative modified peptide